MFLKCPITVQLRWPFYLSSQHSCKQYALAFKNVKMIVSAFGLIVLYQGLLPEFSYIFRPTQYFFWISDEQIGELFV